MTPTTSRHELLHALQEQVRALETARQPQEMPWSSGLPGLDKLLPSKGFRRGTLIEWLAGGAGGGTSTLALLAAREACRHGGSLVVVDGLSRFYPPTAIAWGIDPARLVIVCPKSPRDQQWALHQVLSCPGVAAVLCWPDKLDDRGFRRLQLAAETGGGLGMLVRPEKTRDEPSWAEVRLLVRPQPSSTAQRVDELEPGWRLRVELLRCRGSQAGGVVELEIEDKTGTIHETRALPLASSLASGTARRRSS